MHDPTQYLPGPGPGRPKGLKNKKVISTNDLIDLLNTHNYDPVVDQIMLSRDPDCPHGTRQKINSEFMKLMYPAVKAVEHSGSIEYRSMKMTWDMTAQQQSIQPVVECDEMIEHDHVIDNTIDATPIPQTVDTPEETVEKDDESDF